MGRFWSELQKITLIHLGVKCRQNPSGELIHMVGIPSTRSQYFTEVFRWTQIDCSHSLRREYVWWCDSVFSSHLARYKIIHASISHSITYSVLIHVNVCAQSFYSVFSTLFCTPISLLFFFHFIRSIVLFDLRCHESILFFSNSILVREFSSFRLALSSHSNSIRHSTYHWYMIRDSLLSTIFFCIRVFIWMHRDFIAWKENKRNGEPSACDF